MKKFLSALLLCVAECYSWSVIIDGVNKGEIDLGGCENNEIWQNIKNAHKGDEFYVRTALRNVFSEKGYADIQESVAQWHAMKMSINLKTRECYISPCEIESGICKLDGRVYNHVIEYGKDDMYEHFFCNDQNSMNDNVVWKGTGVGKNEKFAIRANSDVLEWHVSEYWVCKGCIKCSTYLGESYKKDVLSVLDSRKTKNSEKVGRIGRRFVNAVRKNDKIAGKVMKQICDEKKCGWKREQDSYLNYEFAPVLGTVGLVGRLRVLNTEWWRYIRDERDVMVLGEVVVGCEKLWEMLELVVKRCKDVKSKVYVKGEFEKLLGYKNRHARELAEVVDEMKGSVSGKMDERSVEWCTEGHWDDVMKYVAELTDGKEIKEDDVRFAIYSLLLWLSEVVSGKEYVFARWIVESVYDINIKNKETRDHVEGEIEDVMDLMLNTGMCLCLKDEVLYKVQYDHYADLFADE